MPVCQICGRELKLINSNHLSQHGMTLDQYIEQYGDPNKSSLGGLRKTTNARAVKEKAANKRTLTTQQSRTIDDLYELEKTIKVPSTFYWVDQSNVEVLHHVIDLIKQYGKVAVDTETTGLDPYVDRVTHVILTPYDPGRKYNIMIPLYHEDREGNKLPGLIDQEYVTKLLKPVLEDPAIRTVWFNLYFDQLMLENSMGIRVANIVPEKYLPKLVDGRMQFYQWQKGVDVWDGGWDASPASHILNENEPSHKLKDLYARYIYPNETDPDIKALNVETYEEQFGKIKFYRVPKKVATCYGAKDGYITRKMEEFQRPYIDSRGSLDSVLYTLEFQLILPLCDMRQRGIRLDLETAKKVGGEIEEKKEAAIQRVYAQLGENINLNSPKQVSQALFHDLGLPDLQKGSTKAAVLEELADLGYDVAQDLIDYKKMDKLYGSFIAPAEDFISPDGKVHCRFNQLGTKTGRFSSSGPNMQQIPARYGVIRTMFVADEGDVLLGGDFSQIEPRLTAHTCGDQSMIDSYVQGKDLYSMMASKVFTLLAERTATELNHRLASGHLNEDDPVHGMAPIRQTLYRDGFLYRNTPESGGDFTHKSLTPEDCYDGTLYRKMMKTLLLGILYGMSGYGLAARLKISEEDADTIINDFYKSFPKLKGTMDRFKRFATREGYVETEWGRKRRIPDVWAEEKWIRRKAERQLFNSVIQGGAADLMKKAMISVMYDPRLAELQYYPLLSIHDELIGSVPRSNAIEAIRLMVEDMVNCQKLSVPLKVDGEIYVSGAWNSDSISYKGGGFKWNGQTIPEEEAMALIRDNG